MNGWGQSAFIRGSVTSTSGEMLPFASIYIQGTTKGTTSNADGEYFLEVAPGSYNIVYQYIGYKSQIKGMVVPPEGLKFDIALEEDVLELKAVEVFANREDPAYAIIRKAQEMRKSYLERVAAYQCRAYIKGSFKLVETPQKIFGEEVGDMGGMLDTAGQGYIYLSESVSDVYYKAPGQKKEVMISSIVSGDPQGFSFNNASGMDFNFYENTIRFSRALVSPIANNAFDFYKYRLEGVIFDSDGRMVNKISVIPRVKESAAFEGTIYITEDLWNIHDIDLFITSRALKQPLIDTLRIKQIFVPIDSKSGEVWTLFHQQLRVKVGLFGFNSDGDFSAVFSNYKIDPEFPEGLFNKEILVVEEGANERDSQYWASIRPIPLTESELKDYTKKDSLRIKWESPEYLDSVDRENNKFNITALLTGYSHQNSLSRTNWRISPPILSIYFNPVHGYKGTSGLTWNRYLDEKRSRELTLKSFFTYGLAERILNPDLSIGYNWDPIRNQNLLIGWSRGLVSFDPAVPIIPMVAALYSNYAKEHYLKLYREQKLYFQYTGDVRDGLRLKLDSRWSKRNGVNVKTDFSILDFDQAYSSNMPLDLPVSEFDPDEQIINRIELSWRPGMRYWVFPDRRVPIGSRFPLFTVAYERAIPISEKGADWERWQFSVQRRGIRLGNWGYSDAIIRGGMFTREKRVGWPDRFHFNGNEVLWVSGAKYLNGFLMLPYFENSDTDAYGTIHFEHHFNGLLMDRVPLINKLGWKTVVGYSRLQQENGRHWNEVLIGLEHIGISLYRGVRVNIVGAWGSDNQLDWGFRFSLVNFLGVQL